MSEDILNTVHSVLAIKPVWVEKIWHFLRSFEILQDDRMMFVIATTLTHIGIYVAFNAILHVCYHYNLFEKYRIRKGKFPAERLIRECVIHAIFNHLITQPLALYFLYPTFVKHGMRFDENLPDIRELLVTIAISIAVNDTLFYWAHRIFHYPILYKYIHSKHHRFQTSIGIAAEFAHPVESILANSIPTILGPLLYGPHYITFLIWLAIRIFETLDAHSGYRIPFSPFEGWIPFGGGADRHDYHHSHNQGNFGSFFIFWDWICGTDKPYNDWKKNGELESSEEQEKEN